MEEFEPSQTTGHILCCECGIEISPNPSNMCINCLRCKVDITNGIPKQGNLLCCRKCERFLSPPSSWVIAKKESRELLAVCLKRIKSSLQKVRLVDATFLWTEPHSKKIKVKITVQKEVDGGTFLEQTFVVEFSIHNHTCQECHRVEAKDYWKSTVQVRQKVSHKKTFYYLEQLILKHRMHQNSTKITEKPNGLDFFYGSKQDARKFTDFLMSVLPCKYQTSQKLISHDSHSNVFNYKTTFCVEMPPVCKGDIVCLPRKFAQQLGNLGQLLICIRVTNNIHLIDFNTLQTAEVSGSSYWRAPFASIGSVKNLTEFIVMEVEPIHNPPAKTGAGSRSRKYAKCNIDTVLYTYNWLIAQHLLADCWVVRSSELGLNEDYIHTRTHLGHLLKSGDTVMGLDMRTANINNDNLEAIKIELLPDVILVRKVFADRQLRRRRRNWKLQEMENMPKQTETYTEFLEDLEEDKDYRKNVDIYIDGPGIPSSADEKEFPSVSLQEMLQDLSIKDDVEMTAD